MKSHRIDISGQGNPLVNNPFGALATDGLPTGKSDPPPPPPPPAKTGGRKEPNRTRGRVDVIRQTAGRGGKTVTVLTGFKGIAEAELQELARTIQRACGTGGTVKGATIEIQGDQRERAFAALKAAGFQPVRAGG